MTRHHTEQKINILLTRNLCFEYDVRQWSHPLMISYCTACGINRTIEREVNLNATCLLLLLIWFRLIICTVRLLFRSLFKFSSCEKKKQIAKWVLKMWIIINKRHFLIFLDNSTHKTIKPGRRRYNSEVSVNGKKSKKSQTRLMGWYWRRKPTWRKDLITFNSHPWTIFSFNWLVIIWRGVVIWNWTCKVKGMKKIWT